VSHDEVSRVGEPAGARELEAVELPDEDDGGVGEAERREGVAGRRQHRLLVERGEDPLAGLHQAHVAAELLVLLEQRALGEGAVHRVCQPLGVERLDQVV